MRLSQPTSVRHSLPSFPLSLLSSPQLSPRTNPRELFQLLEKLDQGVQPATYKALDLIKDQLVTVKIYPRYSHSCPSHSQTEILKNFNHPSVLRLLDTYTTDNELWLVTEYCQLGSLYNLRNTAHQEFSEAEIAWLCQNVLCGLEYLHNNNQVHGNLTLKSVLVSGLGRAKLTGFHWSIKRYSSQDISQESLKTSRQWNLKKYTFVEDIRALGACIKGIIKQDVGYCSSDLNHFVELCLAKDNNNIPKATELMEHKFIRKHKQDLLKISSNFCERNIQNLEDFRRRKTLQEIQSENITMRQSFGISENIIEDEDSDLEASIWDAAKCAGNKKDEGQFMERVGEEKSYQSTEKHCEVSKLSITSIENPSICLIDRIGSSEKMERFESLVSLEKEIITFGDWKESSASYMESALKYLRNISSNREDQEFALIEEDEDLPKPNENVTVSSDRISIKNFNESGQVDLVENNKSERSVEDEDTEYLDMSIEQEITPDKKIRDSSLKVVTAKWNPFEKDYGHAKPKSYKSINESNFIVKHPNFSKPCGSTDVPASFDSDSVQSQSFSEQNVDLALTQRIADEKKVRGISCMNIKSFNYWGKLQGNGKTASCGEIASTPLNNWKWGNQGVIRENKTTAKKGNEAGGIFADRTVLKGVRCFYREMQKSQLEAAMRREIELIEMKYRRIYEEMEKEEEEL